MHINLYKMDNHMGKCKKNDSTCLADKHFKCATFYINVL